MIAVGVRRVVLARGELDKLEGPKYAARRAELRRKAREAARARDRQAAAPSQNEAEESDESEVARQKKANSSLGPSGRAQVKNWLPAGGLLSRSRDTQSGQPEPSVVKECN